MILSFDDAWYLIILKIIVYLFTMGIASKIAFAYYDLMTGRIQHVATNILDKPKWNLIVISLMIVFNFILVWVMIQVALVLFGGMLGISPMDMVERWNMKEGTFALLLASVLVRYFMFNVNSNKDKSNE